MADALEPLPLPEWKPTCDTLHMWTQIVGKVRLALAPRVNHWWETALYVSPRGLTTSAIPYRDRVFDCEFDFIDHQLVIRSSDGRGARVPLAPRSVADFYAETMTALRAMRHRREDLDDAVRGRQSDSRSKRIMSTRRTTATPSSASGASSSSPTAS